MGKLLSQLAKLATAAERNGNKLAHDRLEMACAMIDAAINDTIATTTSVVLKSVELETIGDLLYDHISIAEEIGLRVAIAEGYDAEPLHWEWRSNGTRELVSEAYVLARITPYN